jgi:DNA (cytosine-5)-methyltransferase 1
MGISKAGFRHQALVEWDHHSCQTIRHNQELGIKPMSHWPLHEMDVRKFDFSPYQEPLDLLAGGPPCQPFSIGGKHRGSEDERNMFPEVFRAVRELAPKAILIENVKGLLRETFSKFFEYIVLQLSYPEVTKKLSEEWTDHLSRLERFHTRGKEKGLTYRVVYRLVNAADYGVPQKRERVIIVGFRNDLGLEWSFPPPTHSQEALLHSQWVTGEYWDRHQLSKRKRPEMPDKLDSRVTKIAARASLFPLEPWQTVRDAISDLPDPLTKKGSAVSSHWVNPGARSYVGHTGSPLDEPAKTLKAGDHGVPGGENTLAFADGSVRYFTVREAARLQTFPDDFAFEGVWTECMRQLGNAVPVRLGNIVASDIKRHLNKLEPKEGGGLCVQKSLITR